MLSGYRLMWIMVLFDLPVQTKAQRKAATSFRQFLLDQGFEMSQFSVYLRFCSGKDQVEQYCRRIGKVVPGQGSVHILSITDKQYENVVTFYGTNQERTHKNPEQYVLF